MYMYDNGKELKKLWQKDKLLTISNFPFWHNVFTNFSHLLQTHQNASVCGKGLIFKAGGC